MGEEPKGFFLSRLGANKGESLIVNAERLHAIATAIRQDLQATGAVTLLQQLRNALSNQVSQPQHPQFQQQVSETFQQLTQRLQEAPSNDFPPTWRQVLDEIGASGFLGAALHTRVSEIFSRNQITPSVAQQEIAGLTQHVERLQASMEQLVTALLALNVGAEVLKPGECELGVLVPRAAVKNSLAEFASELVVLNKILGAFSELATGTRPGFAIRTIASSDLSVWIDLAPKVAACIAVAVERLVALYKQLLEIRRLRQELASHGLQDKSLQGIDAHANTHMKEGIDVLIGELIQRYAGALEETRRNELRNELRIAFNKLANRIDKGYNVEIRVAPEVPSTSEEPSQESTAKAADIQTIVAAAPGLQFLKPGGEPILSLPEPTEENSGPPQA